jgi:hypothetical protein
MMENWPEEDELVLSQSDLRTAIKEWLHRRYDVPVGKLEVTVIANCGTVLVDTGTPAAMITLWKEDEA